MADEALSLRLEKYEGPLDLLLKLIEKNKVNIYDIPIAEITEQYMAYLSELEREDLDLLSERQLCSILRRVCCCRASWMRRRERK